MTDTGDNKEADGPLSAASPDADSTGSAGANPDETTGSEQPAADPSDQFNRKLREVYSDVLDAPVPDRFLDLLAKLDEKSAGKKEPGSN